MFDLSPSLRVCQDLSALQGEKFLLAPSFRHTRSQTLRQWIFKVYKYIQFSQAAILIPAGLQTRESAGLLGTVAKIGALDECISFFLESLIEL